MAKYRGQKISSSDEECVDNQYLDVKEINHFEFDNLDVPLPIKTKKSEEDRRSNANHEYSNYLYKSNVMIEQVELNLYNNQDEKQKEQESKL